jgi:predicted dehydrogenase
MPKIKIALLGTGNHSHANHLPSLARYAAEHPDTIELAAVCDLRQEEAQAAAATYGFGRAYTDLDEMLAQENPDGLIAVTPIQATLPVASQIIRAGVPLLMEKPPGANLDETRQIVDLVQKTGARVMVSVNRRFDLALQRALSFKGERPLEYLRATMIRHRRTQPTFMQDTAIHVVDAMRHIAGDVRHHNVDTRYISSAHWYLARFKFECGADGTLEVLTTSGKRSEEYGLFGPDYAICARVAEFDIGATKAWENDELVVDEQSAPQQPEFVRNGAYGETAEFIAALKEDRAPRPAPADILQSVEICDALASAAK